MPAAAKPHMGGWDDASTCRPAGVIHAHGGRGGGASARGCVCTCMSVYTRGARCAAAAQTPSPRPLRIARMHVRADLEAARGTARSTSRERQYKARACHAHVCWPSASAPQHNAPHTSRRLAAPTRHPSRHSLPAADAAVGHAAASLLPAAAAAAQVSELWAARAMGERRFTLLVSGAHDGVSNLAACKGRCTAALMDASVHSERRARLCSTLHC